MKVIIKKCTKHGDLTAEQIYTWKYKNKTMSRCHQCILDKNKKNREEWMKNPENVEKKRQRDNERYAKNRDLICARRQSEEGKAARREYYKKHAQKYRDEYKVKQQKYRENLDNAYVKRMIRNNDKDLNGIQIHPKMIELKRTLLDIKRKLKTNNFKVRLKNEV